ncbi:hypothetical protein TNCV_1244771 [Trichonephila clavipes]|nr:hypothetical protein TNCV_1244771 [Trichonephila clavipes]
MGFISASKPLQIRQIPKYGNHLMVAPSTGGSRQILTLELISTHALSLYAKYYHDCNFAESTKPNCDYQGISYMPHNYMTCLPTMIFTSRKNFLQPGSNPQPLAYVADTLPLSH